MTRDRVFVLTPKLGSDRTGPHADSAATEAKDVEGRPPGSQGDDVDYLQRRAEQEVAQAQQATNSAAVEAHYKLAEQYLERLSRAKPAEKVSELKRRQ